MTLFALTLIASLVSTLFGLVVASWVSLRLMTRIVRVMVGFSIGVLLGIAFLHSMPEALRIDFRYPHSTRVLLGVFLVGLLVFFILEKSTLLRHDHHHEGDGHEHHHGHDRQVVGRTGAMVLVGDGLHNFIDGVLIATAFIADLRLGVITTLAIVAHEVPQKIGNFIVLLNAQFSRTRAYAYMIFAGSLALLGAVLGYLFLELMTPALPYMLMLSSSAFVYIALSDLIPQSHQYKQGLGGVLAQIGLVLLGLGLILLVTRLGEL